MLMKINLTTEVEYLHDLTFLALICCMHVTAQWYLVSIPIIP